MEMEDLEVAMEMKDSEVAMEMEDLEAATEMEEAREALVVMVEGVVMGKEDVMVL